MIRDLSQPVTDAALGTLGRLFGRAQERRPLPADLLESTDAYLVVFDAPGATSGDIAVRFERGTVSVRLDRGRESEVEETLLFPGRGRTLEGSKRLPAEATVDADAATATLRPNGTVAVRLPKITTEPTDG